MVQWLGTIQRTPVYLPASISSGGSPSPVTAAPDEQRSCAVCGQLAVTNAQNLKELKKFWF